VAPNSQANVPVKLTWNSLQTPASDWVVEARKCRPGVFTARTLLPDHSKYAVVRVINTSAYPFCLMEGLSLGEARVAESPVAGSPRVDRRARPPELTGVAGRG